jgi:hypothetical protein
MLFSTTHSPQLIGKKIQKKRWTKTFLVQYLHYPAVIVDGSEEEQSLVHWVNGLLLLY